ncbi:MAG: hypothetical protein O7H41_15465, partial [Planctomycetota bacterium]|nr:hypothetical protein [Planctomycetota bacterium]
MSKAFRRPPTTSSVVKTWRPEDGSLGGKDQLKSDPVAVYPNLLPGCNQRENSGGAMAHTHYRWPVAALLAALCACGGSSGNTAQSRIQTSGSAIRARNTGTPTLQTNGMIPFNTLGDIWAEGTTIYLAGRFAGEVYIVDASNPDVPTLVGTISGLGIPQDVKAQNGILYVTNEAGGPVGLWIYDVSNPAMPMLLGTLTSPGLANIHNVFVDGDYAYVASNATGDVHVLDVRNPAAPMDIARIPKPGGLGVHDMMARGGICYVAFWDRGFTIADVSTPSAPVVLRNHTYPGNRTHSVWPSDDGRHVFTTDELVGGHLKAFDISDLGNIQQVGSYEAIPNIIIHNAVIDGRYAYISYYVEGLHIVDISDPSNIT